MKLHKLKLTQPYFSQVKYHNGKVENFFKKFEVRKNDRDYQVGDLLLLLEYFPPEYEVYSSQGLSGDGYFTEINYILNSNYTLDNYIILGLNPICLDKNGDDLLNTNIDYKPFLNLTDDRCLFELLELMEHKNIGCYEKALELKKKLQSLKNKL